MSRDDEDLTAEFVKRLALTAGLAGKLMAPDQVAVALLTTATNYLLERNAPADVADLLHGAADEILFKLRGEQPNLQ